jgi:hypothetical protein
METGSGPAGRRRPEDPAAALVDRLFHDMVGALELFTVYLGERLGLYQALGRDGPATFSELAGRTGTAERYIREWLEHHAASGLLEVDDPAVGPLARRYRLPPAHVPVLADRDDVRYRAFSGVEVARVHRSASDLERYHYGWSVVSCLPPAMGDPRTSATGAVMRPATLRRYAEEAGFRSVEVLPLETQTWRFYRLTP